MIDIADQFHKMQMERRRKVHRLMCAAFRREDDGRTATWGDVRMAIAETAVLMNILAYNDWMQWSYDFNIPGWDLEGGM